MALFSKFRKLSVISIGIVISSILYYSNSTNIEIVPYLRKLQNMNNNNIRFSKWDYNWDRQDIKSLQKSEKVNISSKQYKPSIKACRHIILIRHGQYNIQGDTDEEKKLTNLGKLQAEITGMRLAELAIPFTAIVRSTLTRARETSECIQTHLPKVPVMDDCLLVEGFPIPPDPYSGNWKSEKIFFQDGPRIEAAFRKYFHRPQQLDEIDTYTIIVCHANVIRYFVCRALQFPSEAWLRLSLNHGSITWITILSSGRVILRCYGETGHMMPQWITSS